MKSSYTLSGEAQGAATMENSMDVSFKKSAEGPWVPETPLLGSDLEKSQSEMTCAPCFQGSIFKKEKKINKWAPRFPFSNLAPLLRGSTQHLLFLLAS